MKASKLSVLAAAVLTVGGISGVSASAHGPAPSATDATVDPGQFDNPRQNPYFPLRPGTVSRYRGTDEGERYVERVVVTHRTKVIQGVTTTVVSDVLRRADGSLAEKTQDWYAPDNDGNVWYFGEATATYDEHGRLESREGSWQAGARGAVAGLIMPADPRPTDAYRQELYRGHAEDQAWIVQRNASTTVPYGTLHHLVRSFEWTRLERNVLSLKLYAPGLGIVREKDMSGGNESFVLVSVHHR
ncbi:hypothetical protein [Nocardioides sp. T2.26MG-1]|uniref:hypothetical protein n=1 Tax=Nocardioides sp. T2.26MG-1 TaxID=3041166 RepID=UPI002477A8FC|nr:hypothetical protein [Nocardioides sp. T2.26MG-1]CAI9417844.1 hypothetical protein HIDPHFAB_03120 [Nocardioides sp. T2.26MG-1]